MRRFDVGLAIGDDDLDLAFLLNLETGRWQLTSECIFKTMIPDRSANPLNSLGDLANRDTKARSDFPYSIVAFDYQIQFYLPPENNDRMTSLNREADQLAQLILREKRNSAARWAREIHEAAWQISGLALVHAAENSIDAVYAAIDQKIIAKTEGIISLTLTIDCENNQLDVRVIDNGIGATLAALQKIANRESHSTKSGRQTTFIGGNGRAMQEYILRTKNGDQHSVSLSTFGSDGGFILFTPSGPKENQLELAENFPAESGRRGTDFKISFPFPYKVIYL